MKCYAMSKKKTKSKSSKEARAAVTRMCNEYLATKHPEVLEIVGALQDTPYGGPPLPRGMFDQ